MINGPRIVEDSYILATRRQRLTHAFKVLSDWHNRCLLSLNVGDRGGMGIANWIAAVTVALVSLGGASSTDASPITTLFSTGDMAF